ncbi:MAG: cob(I)yrinic acid a,c-diamide adenosyltransferase [bacterium]|nr:cob(I)yrinic acid a,c-diamide adenosyltransferase [bacterium]
MQTGLIQVYTGNGKGKTTAALGLALRARAVGKRVAIVFFDKGGEHYSERALLGSIGVDWFGYGLDRIDPTTNRFRFGVIAEDISQAEQGIAKALELFSFRHPERSEAKSRDLVQQVEISPLRSRTHSGRNDAGGYDLLILDEINTTVALGMLPESAVEHLLDAKPSTTEILLTGRTEVSKAATNPPGQPWPNGPEQQRWLSYFNRADLLTEMHLHKHYFYQGTPAREGIDY